jgi:hypothetical protein
MSKKGFVYILLNPSFIDIIKIGKTTRTSEERAKELYQKGKTSIPTKFVVAYENEVSDCDLVESIVHKKLGKYSLNPDREFFNLPLKQAIKTIEGVIADLEKQHKLDLIQKQEEVFTPKKWWQSLSFVWQQIFRNHLNLTYPLNELDLYSSVHSIIDNCQDERLRKKVADLIAHKKFTQQLTKWYKNLGADKHLFNSYLPYEPTEQEIEQIFKLTKINCSNNSAVFDLKPLEKLIELKEINTINTNISDLTPLFKLKFLEEINLNFTKIDSLEPLENLPNLQKITCYATDLTANEIERFSKIKTKCEVASDIFLTFEQSIKPNKVNKNIL